MSELEKRCHIYTTKLFRKSSDLLYTYTRIITIIFFLSRWVIQLLLLCFSVVKETSVKVNLQTQAYLTQAEIKIFFFTLALTAFG